MATYYVDNALNETHGSGTAQGGDTTSITLGASAPATDDLFNGWGIYIRSGAGAGQCRRITDYVGATRTATIIRSWDESQVPNDTSGYEIQVGSDENVGTSEGVGNAYMSLHKAFAEVDPGDVIYLKGLRAQTYKNSSNSGARIVTAGQPHNPVRVIGYLNTVGDLDTAYVAGGFDVLDYALSPPDRPWIGGAGTTIAIGVDAAAALLSNPLYYIFENIGFAYCTSHGLGLYSAYSSYLLFRNCFFSHNGGHGAHVGPYANFEGCQFVSNSQYGVSGSVWLELVGCRSALNTQHQVAAIDGHFEDCLVYSAAQTAYDCIRVSGSGRTRVHGCTLDGSGSGGSGYGVWSGYNNLSVQDSIITRCGVGIHTNSADVSPARVKASCLYGNGANTSGQVLTHGGLVGCVTDDPKFVGIGDRDYALSPDSPCIGAASWKNRDVGAIQYAGAGAGTSGFRGRLVTL